MAEPLPALSQAYVTQAAQLFLDNQIPESNAVVEQLCTEHPGHLAIWRLKNNLLLAQNRAADAVNYFRKHLPPAPTRETLEHFCLLARAERYMGNPKRALEIACQVLVMEPALLEARFEYGLAYYHVMPVRQDCNWKTISVCLPSRLTRHPTAGWYWLERAVASIRSQTVAGKFPIQICVGVDHGTEVSEVFANQPDIIFAAAAADAPRNQAAAVNAAASVATGDIIAFLEDDDVYFPQRLENALELLHRYDFVGGTQQAVSPAGVPFQIHDYANPTTWVMRHDFWHRVGPMDTSFRLHLDAEWLGRLNASGGLRVHEVDAPAPREWHTLATSRKFYPYFYSVIKPGSGVYFTKYGHPLAAKTVHENSVMDFIRTSPELQKKSDAEHVRMETMYNGRPF